MRGNHGFFRKSKCYEENGRENKEDCGGSGRELKTIIDLYEEVAINCFRFFNFTSFDDVDNLTIAQYEILMKSVRKRMVDQEYHEHRQAFLNFSVQSQKKSGKNKTRPVYSTFKKFYDYEKRMKEVEGGGKPKSRIFDAIVRRGKGSDSNV